MLNLTQRSYFYLVAGLPDLALQQTQMSLGLRGWIGVLEKNGTPADLQQLQLLRLPADHHNLLAWLYKEDTPDWKDTACYPGEELIDGLQSGKGLPGYIHEVYDGFRQKKDPPRRLVVEHELTEKYYAFALPRAKGLTQAWLSFDRNLRNLLSAWNRRKHHLTAEQQVVGQNDITQAIHRNAQARDFGLGQAYPRWYWWVHEADADGLLERQQNLNRIRWNFIEEQLRFAYFSFDVLLGYFLKLQILESRLGPDAQRGQERLDHYIEQIAEQFSLL